jgi:hypothetical protein
VRSPAASPPQALQEPALTELMPSSILERARIAASKRLLYVPHAVRQMSHPERMITPSEVEAAVRTGELIEDYPSDPRGHSCLLLGWGEEGRPIHVVCSPKEDYLAIITAYLPDPDQWANDFKWRR